MRRKVALTERQGAAAQPLRGAENENGSGTAPRRCLIQIEGDRVRQCCRVGVMGQEQKLVIHHFLRLQCAISKKKILGQGGQDSPSSRANRRGFTLVDACAGARKDERPL
jgi:hypothetical protein